MHQKWHLLLIYSYKSWMTANYNDLVKSSLWVAGTWILPVSQVTTTCWKSTERCMSIFHFFHLLSRKIAFRIGVIKSTRKCFALPLLRPKLALGKNLMRQLSQNHWIVFNGLTWFLEKSTISFKNFHTAEKEFGAVSCVMVVSHWFLHIIFAIWNFEYILVAFVIKYISIARCNRQEKIILPPAKYNSRKRRQYAVFQEMCQAVASRTLPQY